MPTRFLAPSLIAVLLVIVAAFGYQVFVSSSSTAAPSSTTEMPVLRPHTSLPGGQGVLGEADGAVFSGVTVFDDEVPAVSNLDQALLNALRRAAMDAANDDVDFVVESGWRSPRYQKQLLRDAISKYGSEAEAARWVATADTSLHVSGDAVDIGPSQASKWLGKHGAKYGLCQIYKNEPWHFELRVEAVYEGCPSKYTDPSHDPRMQK